MPLRLSAPVTLTVINALRPGEVVHDAKLKGFGARRQREAISYFLKFRQHGRQRWVTIGQHGRPWTPDSARKHALQILADPTLADKKSNTPDALLFAEVAEFFLTKHGPKLRPRTLVEYRHIVTHYLNPAFGKLLIANISLAQISSAHVTWAEYPRRANFALTVLSKLFNWCEDEGHRPEGTNPVRRVERFEEGKRERYLTAADLRSLGAALNKAERENLVSPFPIAALRLLILTGARMSEILTLQWSFIDFERAMIFLPMSKNKGGQKSINLNTAAIAVLKAIPRFAHNPYVIIGKKNGAHLANLHKPWQVVRDLSGIANIRIHDLRHTYASISVASGGSLPMIGKMLGHSNPSTTQRYAHLAGDGDPVRQLTETTGKLIAAAMAGKPTSDDLLAALEAAEPPPESEAVERALANKAR